ncbi:MAG TPA: M23 family metallopeptidase, partial [Povalibacter sp.]|nr:M23 family metallopeptidase [Povalibacter sp.]
AVSVTGEVAVHRAALPVLMPPLRGGPWVALYDPAMMGGHRRMIYTLAGRARIPARFAIDWMLLDQQGNYARGDASKVANWYGYSADVLAVADALVVEAHDDVGNQHSIGESQGSMALEYASGNYIVLDLGNAVHAFYEHLQQGTLRVKAGDRVLAGQVIARVGNTGSSSSGPHLHFHVADGPATLAAEGQAYVFSEFEVVGAYDSIEAAVATKPWHDPGAKGGRHTQELPDANVVVVFR